MTRRWLDPAFFTDEKMKRATIPERLMGAAIIANQDDDGRLRGDPAYLRSIAFLYDDYSLEEVKSMRDHLAQVNPNILVYANAGDEYIQLVRYKRYQKPRYYHASKFPAPPGWPFANQPATEQSPSSTLSGTRKSLISVEPATNKTPEGNQTVTTGEGVGKGIDLGKGKDKGVGEGVGQTHTHATISQALKDNFPLAFSREPTSREKAYLRDIAKAISPAGATPQQVYDAFREAARHNKLDLSYVRAILYDWLEIPRSPPPD